MKLQEIKYSQQLIDLFAEYQQIGVVLDICILEFDVLENVYEASRAASVLAMKIFSQRYLEKLILLNPGRDVSKYFQIKIDEDILPAGEEINSREFLGEGFDFENNRVNLFRYSERGRSGNFFDGITRALLDPPYGIRIMPPGSKLSVEYGLEEQKRMTALLFDFLDQILNVKSITGLKNLQIYSWSNDWSNYFNSGKEWWGTFYWTILDSQRKTISVIGASQTD